MNKSKWKPFLRSLAFYQNDLWGEIVQGFRSKSFKTLPKIYFALSRPLARSVGIRIRLKNRDPRTTNGRLAYIRRKLTKYYVGLRKSHFLRLYRLGKRRLGIRSYRTAKQGYFTSSTDWSFRLLEARIGSLAQRTYTTRSNLSIKQRLLYGYAFLNGRATYNSAVLARPGDVATLYNFTKPLQSYNFGDVIKVFLRKSRGWKFKKWFKGTVGTSTACNFQSFLIRKRRVSPAFHRNKLVRGLVPYLAGRKTQGLVRSYTGQVMYLGGPGSKLDIHYPFPAKLHQFA